MKLKEWIPVVDRRVKSREEYRHLDFEACDAFRQMYQVLSWEQRAAVSAYLNVAQTLAMLRMVEAYEVGLEHGQMKK